MRASFPLVIKVLYLVPSLSLNDLRKNIELFAELTHAGLKESNLVRGPDLKGHGSPQRIQEDIESRQMKVLLVMLLQFLNAILLLSHRRAVVHVLDTGQVVLVTYGFSVHCLDSSFLDRVEAELVFIKLLPLRLRKHKSGILSVSVSLLHVVDLLAEYTRRQFSHFSVLFEVLDMSLLIAHLLKVTVVVFFHVTSHLNSLKDVRVSVCNASLVASPLPKMRHLMWVLYEFLDPLQVHRRSTVTRNLQIVDFLRVHCYFPQD